MKYWDPQGLWIYQTKYEYVVSLLYKMNGCLRFYLYYCDLPQKIDKILIWKGKYGVWQSTCFAQTEKDN